MSSDARPSVLAHATEELLEEYSFGRISEPQLGWLEEHLLICGTCQDRLQTVDGYVAAIRAAAKAMVARKAPAGPARAVKRASGQ